MAKDELLSMIRDGRELSRRQCASLVLALSLPAILSQLSTIIEEYVDAMMVGQLGANASASITLVSTSLWLIGGLSHSASTGFYVQVAHHIGANDFAGARSVLRQGLTACMSFCMVLVAIGLAIAPWLPQWLGANQPQLWHDASWYFAIFCLSMPLHQLCSLMGGALRCAGHIRVPALLQVMCCVLNVGFNYWLIFRCGMGVIGAAIGTCAAELVTATALTWYTVARCPQLRFWQDAQASFRPTRITLLRSLHIAGPVGIEHIIMNVAQIVITAIVAPLGAVALASNGFGITIESLCYMPGFGIGDAATTLVGQSLGAGRKPLCRRFAYLTVGGGILVMSLFAVVMYVGSPWLMQFMTTDASVQQLTAHLLRIEAFAEPMYAASIVSYGVFVGAGDTILPCSMNLGSIWLVRIPLALLLVGSMGLTGVWIAMAIELCFRGSIFLWRLKGNAWLNAYKIRD